MTVKFTHDGEEALSFAVAECIEAGVQKAQGGFINYCQMMFCNVHLRREKGARELMSTDARVPMSNSAHMS